MTIDLVEEQLRLEEEARCRGANRFFTHIHRSQENGQEQGTFYGSHIMRRVVGPLRKAIEDELDGLKVGRAGNRSKFLKLVKDFPTDVLAYLTARVVVSSLIRGSTLTYCASAIATAIQNETMLADFEENQPGLYRHLLNEYGKNSQQHRLTVLRRAYYAHCDDPNNRWPSSDGIHVGIKLIHLMVEATGVVQIETRTKPSGAGQFKTVHSLSPTPQLLEWIERTTDARAMTQPVCLPMVVEPRPWTDAFDGGYISFPPKLVGLVRGTSGRGLQEFNNRRADMPGVYEAVNRAQSVAWEINRDVLAVAEHLWEGRQEIAGLAAGERREIPPSPFAGREKESLTEEEATQLRIWKLKARDTHEWNAKMAGRRLGSGQALAVAKQFTKYDRIWFPHNFDFRGRIYAIPIGLTPQGADLSKGLLRFADGKPIGDGTGPGWLAVHGANSWGNDKVSFEDRIDWVEENEARILSCAADPVSDLWWTEADSPFCFLAFCLEWAGFCRDGADHVTHLPVALDGSCSGLQHYSAALRDPVGGAAVNLTPGERPADVYNEVAQRALELLKVKAVLGGDDAPLAKALIEFGLDRKAAKRPTMTLPYGSTRISCGQYIREWLLEKASKLDDDKNPLLGQEIEAVNVLAPIIWDAIGDVVQSARVAMAWLRKLASASAKEDMPLTWTTPDGFVVSQHYKDTSERRVKTHMGDKLVYLSILEEVDKLDRRKQSSGFPPNWVHSMDATHLRMATVDVFENGITSVALIHDSFGTLACDCDTLGAVLREALIELYSEKRLDGLRSEVCSYLLTSENVPPAPATGSLDLNLIREAQFTFA